MPEIIITLLIGLLGGVAVGTQTPISNAIAQRVGGVMSSFIVHITGAFFSALLLVREPERIRQFFSLPVWMYGVGGFGVVLFLTINYTIPRLGATTAVALLIIGQLFAGAVIDHFGLLGVVARPLDGTRLVALTFLVVGGYLIAR